MIFEGNKLLKKYYIGKLLEVQMLQTSSYFQCLIKAMPLEVKILLLTMDIQLYK